MTIPRPGHADLTATLKYGYRDLRLGLERASARETAARVAAGAACRSLLGRFSVSIGSYVIGIGSVRASIEGSYQELFQKSERSPVRCPNSAAEKQMIAEIERAAKAKDTAGGTLECVALGLPPGLGSHVQWDRRLSSRLMAAVGSIPAIKGVQFGEAFSNATLWGTAVHDPLGIEELGDRVKIKRATNRAGGLEGGITTGEPLVIRAAMKPISTILKGMPSVDLATAEQVNTVYERSDVCAVPRACVVAEAMVAFVLADALIEKLGGDSLDEMVPRFYGLKQGKLGEIPMDNVPWQFGYE